jgi:hypothetical protein
MCYGCEPAISVELDKAQQQGISYSHKVPFLSAIFPTL